MALASSAAQVLVSGRATQSWLKRQHVSHIRTVQPKELCRVVLIDAVRVSVYTVRPAQQPATAKVPHGFHQGRRFQRSIEQPRGGVTVAECLQPPDLPASK